MGFFGEFVQLVDQRSGKTSPHTETLDELKSKWPDIDNLLRTAGIAESAGGLTQSQAKYILKFSPDTFRGRAIAQGNARGGRTRRETLGAPSAEEVGRAGQSRSRKFSVTSAFPRLNEMTSDEQLVAMRAQLMARDICKAIQGGVSEHATSSTPVRARR